MSYMLIFKKCHGVLSQQLNPVAFFNHLENFDLYFTR